MADVIRRIPFIQKLMKTPLSGLGNGLAGASVTAVEKGDGIRHVTELTFKDVPIPLIDNAGVVAYFGRKIYDFPEGSIKVEHAVANLIITKSSAGVNADFDGDFAIGSVTANNNAVLATTEQNIIPTTPTPQAVAGVTTAKGTMTAAFYTDGSGKAAAFLNMLVDDTDHDVTTTPCSLIFNGTVKLVWVNGGDLL